MTPEQEAELRAYASRARPDESRWTNSGTSRPRPAEPDPDSPLRSALTEARRRTVAGQDHVNGEPWDNAYVRGYNAATGVALAHYDAALAAAPAASPRAKGER